MFFVDFNDKDNVEVNEKYISRILVVHDGNLIQIANNFDQVDKYCLDNSMYKYILCNEDGTNTVADNIKSPDEHRVFA